MPNIPKKICAHPGCHRITDSKYCAVHTPMHKSIFESANKFNYKRKSATQRGYNSRWQKVSKLFLKEHPICECEECIRDGKLTTANVVHHIIPHHGNYELFWDQDNWQAMNKRCHDRHTLKEIREGEKSVSWEGYRFNDNGEMVPIKVYLVWGPPASGKTTYVKEHMQNGDLIVDLDMIKQSISLADKTEALDVLLEIAIGIKDYLYELINKRKIKSDAWIIAGLPTHQEREIVVKKTRPDEIIFIDKTKEECILQAKNDPERKDKEQQIKIISKWFRKYYNE